MHQQKTTIYSLSSLAPSVKLKSKSKKKYEINNVIVDVFSNAMPEWVQEKLTSREVNSEVIRLNEQMVWITKPQRILCTTRKNSEWSNTTQQQQQYTGSMEQNNFMNIELIRNCLTHGREFCRIHLENGDVMQELDYGSPFLNIRGETLTNDLRSLERLQNQKRCLREKACLCNNNVRLRNNNINNNNNSVEHELFFDFIVKTANNYELGIKNRTKRGNLSANILTLPFYLTFEDVCWTRKFFPFLQSRQCHMWSMNKIKEIFISDEFATEIINTKNETCKVVNICSLYETPISKYITSSMFSVFRKYKPINVLTRREFCEQVTKLLRVESAWSRRWCSVWGTIEEYEQCSIHVLDGALSVYTTDTLGNPVKLVNAICTKDPFRAFCSAYPNKYIIFSLT